MCQGPAHGQSPEGSPHPRPLPGRNLCPPLKQLDAASALPFDLARALRLVPAEGYSGVTDVFQKQTPGSCKDSVALPQIPPPPHSLRPPPKRKCRVRSLLPLLGPGPGQGCAGVDSKHVYVGGMWARKKLPSASPGPRAPVGVSLSSLGRLWGTGLSPKGAILGEEGET